MSKRPPIVYDPGWLSQAAQIYPGSRAGLASYAEDQMAFKGIGMVCGRGKPRYSVRWKPSQASAYDRAERSGVEIHSKGKRTVVAAQHLSRRVTTI